MLATRDPRPQGRLLQVHERDAQRHRGDVGRGRPGRARRGQRHRRGRRLRAGARRATRSCSSTIGRRRSRCPRCRCSPCCPAPAGSRGSSTSATCAATSPTCSRRRPRASRASRPSSGGSSTRSRRRRRSPSSCARVRSPGRADVGPTRRRRGSRRCGPLEHRFVVGRAIERRRRDDHRAGRSARCAESLEACRELDDAILDLRFNEPEIGTWVLRTEGDADAVLAADAELGGDGWLAARGPARSGAGRSSASTSRRARSSRSSTPGSCFAGTLAELALAADRTLMLDDGETVAAPRPTRTTAGTRWRTACSRLATRFWGRDDDLARGRGAARQGPARPPTRSTPAS